MIRAFIVPHRQERYLGFIANPKKRAKLLGELAHFRALNPEFQVAIPPNQQNPEGVLKILRSRGASQRCWVISENREIDGLETDLTMALEETIGRQMGTIISCVPGKLAYFEDEDARFVLAR